MNPASPSLDKHEWSWRSPQSQEIVGRIRSLVQLMKSIDSPNSDLTAVFHHQLQEIDNLSHSCIEERPKLLDFCLEQTSLELSPSLVHRQGRDKPFGYAGDFQIIDWTYLQFDGSAGRGKLWDQFYHRQDAPLAVCDRKDRFGRILQEMAREVQARPLHVLNVASGPGRELLDGAKHAGLMPSDLDVLCVEIDSRAIDYASRLLGDQWKKSVRFHKGNALRFRPPGEFDLIWCAGLFDYLEERLAVFLLRNLWKAVAPGGRLVIGNFATTHRTRAWIEWCGAWFLNHRSEHQLGEIAKLAAIPCECCHQSVDKWQAIRFLHAMRPQQ